MFNDLEKRIIEFSYKHQLSHISSCLNTVNLLAMIYDQRKDDEPVVLGNSHAALALFVVLESKGYCDAEAMLIRHGTHASRDMEHGVWVSGGALGQPETIAVGMALADKNRMVWLVTSDGSCMEGATHEAIRFGRKLDNLLMFIVYNGCGAYSVICRNELPLGPDVDEVFTEGWPDFLIGLQGHYIKLTKEQYEQCMTQ